ncbi:MAG: cytochrome P450 [Moorea sp. SIO3G5]|nr:cytochrome P450 [Moorena sp. SIO3G5]
MEQITNSSKEIIRSSNTKKSEKVKPFPFNPFSAGFRANPYPVYHRLLFENPICHTVGGDWVLTRYKHIKTILRDSRVYSDNRPKLIQQKSKYFRNLGKSIQTLADTSNKFLFYMNPPDHTRLRRLASKAFSPVVIEGMRPQIQTIVDEALDEVRNKGEMDIIADLAELLPLKVIASMLGVPPNDAQEQLHQWSHILSRILDPLISLEEYEAINKAILEFQEYFRKLISKREKDPQDDIISYLIAARDDSDKLSEEEVLSTCILLFMAGEETTVNTIGNGMLALLNYPEQMEKLKQEPKIIQTAVEEMLRYDSPVQMAGRIASEKLEIGGQTIQKGEKMHLCLGSANRDPDQFPHPDRFDVLRQENNHLAFGDGIHYCLGAALARTQAEIAINSLIEQLPNLKLASDKLEWRKNIVLRGLKALPVKF